MSAAKFASITVDIERRVRQGSYSGRLPTTLALAEEFGVARQTITNALRPLVERGLLAPAGKRGMLIAASVPRQNSLIGIVTGLTSDEIAFYHPEAATLELIEREGFEAMVLGLPQGYRWRDPARFFRFADQFAGILFAQSSLTAEISFYLDAKKVPFLSCNRLPVYPQLNYVGTASFAI